MKIFSVLLLLFSIVQTVLGQRRVSDEMDPECTEVGPCIKCTKEDMVMICLLIFNPTYTRNTGRKSLCGYWYENTYSLRWRRSWAWCVPQLHEGRIGGWCPPSSPPCDTCCSVPNLDGFIWRTCLLGSADSQTVWNVAIWSQTATICPGATSAIERNMCK